MVKFPTCGAFHVDFMDYSAAVAVLEGCCLPDCHCKRIMTAREVGRAITIGSTAVHDGTIWVTKVAWQMPGGFASAARKNAVHRNQMTAPVTMHRMTRKEHNA